MTPASLSATTFHQYLKNRTNEDGSDLGSKLGELFYILNTPKDKRLRNLDEDLALFPYVNGKLFEEPLPPASFDSAMRNILLECCGLNWGKISPAIFGSLFQSVMDPQARRNLGAHYTSEKNILKVIKPLFLDELWKEFETVKDNRNKLLQFHEKVSLLRFLDPACGCGNFLVISYRELRLLELEIIKTLQKGQQMTDIAERLKLNVDRFYGIELEEFPSQIAQVGMWLTDHQMNLRASEEFGEYYIRLPLTKRPNIVQGNALRLDWQDLIDPIPWEKKEQRYDYIFGNPPFIGHHYQNESQKSDIDLVFKSVKGCGVLDYVAAWYLKTSQYIQEQKSINSNSTKAAFVSTNSISQGEQVGILWNELFYRFKIKIHFAHRTFKWGNEARSNAAVHVVIIGFSNFDIPEKLIFEYDDIKGEPHKSKVKNISPYLFEGNDKVVINNPFPICNVPKMIWGNKPTDGGNFIFDTEEEYVDFIQLEPLSKKWISPYFGGEDFLHNKIRKCLWLKDIKPEELKAMPIVLKRVESVRKMRLNSKAEATRKKSSTPYLFAQIAQPDSSFLAVPEVSSEKRKYIPIAFFEKNYIASNTVQLVPNANLWHFGTLTSEMHMTWVRYVCGRLKSDIGIQTQSFTTISPGLRIPRRSRKRR
jgi:hypothetical protein